MTYYYQFMFLLLAAGHIYCLQEFPLENGNTLEVSSIEKIEKDVFCYGTRIEKLLSYNVEGLNKTIDTQENLRWSADIVSVSESQLENLHHNVTNCKVYLHPHSSESKNGTFKVLQKYIWNDICENSTTINEATIDLYEGKTDSIISQLKNIQAGDDLDTVMDVVLILAQKKFKFNDYIDLSAICFNSSTNVTIGNLSTIARARNITVSNNDDLLSLDVLLKMKFEATLDVPILSYSFRIGLNAPKTVAGATIKLDYSKEKCRIVVDDVKLDFRNSLRISLPELHPLLQHFAPTSAVDLILEWTSPSFLKPFMKAQLNQVLKKFLNCE